MPIVMMLGALLLATSKRTVKGVVQYSGRQTGTVKLRPGRKEMTRPGQKEKIWPGRKEKIRPGQKQKIRPNTFNIFPNA